MRKALLLTVLAALAACGEPDSVVLVKVAPIDAAPVARLEVRMTVGTQMQALDVRPPDGTATFLLVDGTRFTVQVPRGISGAVDVEISARSADDIELARGQGHLDSLAVGALSEIDVSLAPP
jgi:hypothetical protein